MDGGRIELQYPHKDFESTIEKLVERNQSFDIVIKSDFDKFAAVKWSVDIFTQSGYPGFWKTIAASIRVSDLWASFGAALHETDYVVTSSESEEELIVSFDAART